jgi:hypothetical protein
MLVMSLRFGTREKETQDRRLQDRRQKRRPHDHFFHLSSISGSLLDPKFGK